MLTKDRPKARSLSPRTDRLEFRSLRHFAAVAEELSFTRAAKGLDMERSPLSRSIATLERRLGVKLFSRSRQAVQLTEDGKNFYPGATQVLEALDQALASVQESSAHRTHRLRLGFSSAVAHPTLAKILARFRAEHPGIALHLHEMSALDQIDALKRSSIDAGLTFLSEPRDRIRVERLWSDSVMLLLPARHALASQRHVELKDLVREPLVLHDAEASDPYRAHVDALLRTVTETPRVEARVSNFAALLTCVAAGLGVGFTTAGQTEAFQRLDVVIRPLSKQAAKLVISLLYRDEPMSALLEQFLEVAKFVMSSY